MHQTNSATTFSGPALSNECVCWRCHFTCNCTVFWLSTRFLWGALYQPSDPAHVLERWWPCCILTCQSRWGRREIHEETQQDEENNACKHEGQMWQEEHDKGNADSLPRQPAPSNKHNTIHSYEQQSNRKKVGTTTTQAPSKDEINKRDKNYKIKMTAYRTNWNNQGHNFVKGDCVLVAQKKINKWTLQHEAIFYTIRSTIM